MIACRELLGRPHLTLLSAQPDRELDVIGQIVTDAIRIEDRADVEQWLGRLAAESREAPVVPKTLDLLGHSAAATGLVALGDWVIDAASPSVTRFFRGLADANVFSQLGIQALRLLGCRTAATQQGRATIAALAEILEIEVYGTAHLLYDAHYEADGFRDAWQFLLCSSRELAREPSPSPIATAHPRSLDVDVLPARSLEPEPTVWLRRIASPRAARQILRLVRRDEGARFAGLLARPSSEIVLPSRRRGAFHTAHVLFDGAFVRLLPDGEGIVYPVADPDELRRVIAALPIAH